MDDRQIILEQYRIYNEAKERYIDRAFMINRFFILLVGILFLILLASKTFFSLGYGFSVAGEVLGIALCVMWFANQDSYTAIIKIKYNKVLENMVSLLPFSPIKNEYEELCKLKGGKRVLTFKDIQKWFAVIMTMIFIANLIMDLTDWVIFSFFAG